MVEKKEAKEVVVRQGAEIGQVIDANDFMSNFDGSDILIPKILSMQLTSQLVGAEKALPGELRSSIDGTMLSKKDKPLEFMAFFGFKQWLVFEEQGNELVYKATVPFGPDNADAGRPGLEDQPWWRRRRTWDNEKTHARLPTT